MVLSGKQTGRMRLALAAAGLLLCASGVRGAGDPEVDRWFNRHTDAVWRPLAEKWDASKAAMTSPVDKLMLPLDYYPSGRIKSVLRAQKAQMLLEGLVFAEGVRVEMLAEGGQIDSWMTADACLFDRNTKEGYCEGVVNVEKSGDRLKGRGMYFSMEQQFIKILAECEIRTHRMQQLKIGRL